MPKARFNRNRETRTTGRKGVSGLKVTKERQGMDTQTTQVFQDKGYVIPRTAKGDWVASHPRELGVRVVGCTNTGLGAGAVALHGGISLRRRDPDIKDDMFARAIEVTKHNVGRA